MPGATRLVYPAPGVIIINGRIQVTARGTAPQDIHYTVDFPDGRTETFNYSAADVDYRAAPGVRERLQPWTATNGTTGVCYLVLPDGGKVEFTGTRIWMYDPELIPPNWYEFDLVATAIIDPYGLRTTFTYDAYRRLSRVTEPAGRYLQFTYVTNSGPTISRVTASDLRYVQYTYTTISPGGRNYSALTSVVYYNNPTAWTAHYTYRAPNVGAANGLPLLSTADDPMYPGPMKRIAYTYRTTDNFSGNHAVYGQISSEKSYDGTATVSTLEVTTATTRKETRGDNKWRTFTYTSTGYLSSLTDFKGTVSASQTYDANKYINSVTDRNGHTTNFTSNALNGNMTVTTFPLTPNDTQPQQTQRPTIQYTYGWANCPDPNNRDANNPYYLYSITDEGGHATIFTRDANKRITRIDYPDGGYETFTYNSFGQVLTHRMTTGGTETFTYSGGLKRTYSDPYHDSNNPSIRYYYDGLDRLNGIYDALGHPTNWEYNLRGQLTVTTLTADPVDGVRHTIINAYNPDGTLQNTTNERGQVTSYTYDDYRRLRSVTPPVRGVDDFTPHPTYFSFHPSNATGDYYQCTDSSVTYVTLPNTQKIKTTYDDNRRKIFVTAAVGTIDAATTSYEYDNAGNLTKVRAPKQQDGQPYATRSTTTVYDERNRPSSVTDAGNYTTIFTYDLAGRKKKVTRPNNQTITYDTFDEINRVTQQTVTQSPGPLAITKYTYYPSGLLESMQDPRLVATNSSENYSYIYDNMGRKQWITYPIDSGGARRTERFTYDTAGRLETFKNRAGNVQTFSYDALNRMTGFSWNDGVTPSVSFGYDAGSRLIEIDNPNAKISRYYYNDNLLRVEHTEDISGNPLGQMVYTYDGDGNRASADVWPGGASLDYLYTWRDQLKYLKSGASTLATYEYDLDGNLSSRSLNNSTGTTYAYDALDQVTWVTHSLTGTTRRLTYGYDNVGNRKWAQRDLANGDVFGYDFNDQVIAVKLNIPDPTTAPAGAQSIIYDANGNRAWFTPYGSNDQYVINDLNQYTSRNGNSATYNANGDLRTFEGTTCGYDAQNRLTSVSKPGLSATFKYDGLNRQVSRTVGGVTTYNVWDGWDLVAEYENTATVLAKYVHGTSGLVKNLVTNNYYYQDGSGSTSHLASSGGALLEWYRYDLQGTPIFYNAANVEISGSNFGIRHLFTGQQWYSELGLYDLRNRFYSPDIGRFLQPDPVGFAGDPTNLYRYCGNNPVTRSDPTGMATGPDGNKIIPTNGFVSEVVVEAPPIPDLSPPDPNLDPLIGGGPGFNLDTFGTFVTLVGGSPNLTGGLFGRLPVNPFTPPNALPKNNPFAPGAAFSLIPPPLNPPSLDEQTEAALDSWAGWAQANQKEVAGTINSSGQAIVGPESSRKPTQSNPGPITANTVATWHFHLLLPNTTPYQFSSPPGGSDTLMIAQYPNLSHYVGVLNAPAGQFTIFAWTPEMPYMHFTRLGPYR